MSEQRSVGPWREITESLQRTLASRADFIRAACVLEATAPKVGNVHPGASFHDLTFDHFVTAAGCTAESMGHLRNARQVGTAIRSAVRASRLATATNVNLGIVLLLGPLLASEPEVDLAKPPGGMGNGWVTRWRCDLADVLQQITPMEGGYIASAIAEAQAGGMETAEVNDDDPLNINTIQNEETTPPPYDVIKAMRSAADRDQIARQYASGFQDLFETVVPTIKQSVEQTQDLLSGIVLAHIRLLASCGDSLVERKCGRPASLRLQQLAKRCLDDYGDESIQELDEALRGNANRLNPGTTADLIAAGLYVCLRELS